MKLAIIILTFLCLPSLAFCKVKFFEGSLNEVQRAAAIEGKLYFIDFYAAYCLPCKLMDQTTFMDENLANYISGNYIPLKLNIDDFDAYEVRSKHELKALPTVMIFSSSGKLLESYEGSLTATALNKLLVKHNIPENRQKSMPTLMENIVDTTNNEDNNSTQPTEPNEIPTLQSSTQPPINSVKPIRKPQQKPIVEKPTTPEAIVKPIPKPRLKPINNTNQFINTPEKPTLQTLDAPIIEAPQQSQEPEIPIKFTEPEAASHMKPIKPVKPSRKPSRDDVISYESKPIIITSPTIPESKPQLKPQPISKPIITQSELESQSQSKAKGLFEFFVKKHPSKGYAVQIGLFAEYSNVLVEVEKIQRLFPDRKVIVHIDEFNEKTVYRVAIGTFTSYAATKNYLPKIKQAGFDGFIKNLSTLE